MLMNFHFRLPADLSFKESYSLPIKSKLKCLHGFPIFGMRLSSLEPE